VRFVTVLAVVILLVGCSQAAPSVEKQQKREGPERIEKAPPREPSPDLPTYDVTFEQHCAETGVVGKCYGVSTDATSREELEVIIADLWLDSPGYLAVLVTFYPNKPTAHVRATGFAFENEQVARVVLAQFLAQGTSVEDEVREAMANGGIYVLAPADEAQELGLLGPALDPNFPANPYVYVLYTYDHQLGSTQPAPRWGTAGILSDPCPSPPGATADGCVVSGRLSRLQVDPNTNRMTGGEQVLIEDWCQQYSSHSIGDLAFGPTGLSTSAVGTGRTSTSPTTARMVTRSTPAATRPVG
jgi:hypothetical protein